MLRRLYRLVPGSALHVANRETALSAHIFVPRQSRFGTDACAGTSWWDNRLQDNMLCMHSCRSSALMVPDNWFTDAIAEDQSTAVSASMSLNAKT